MAGEEGSSARILYPAPSSLEALEAGAQLRLVTSQEPAAPSHFFRGRLVDPVATASLLLTIGKVALSRFYTPPGMLARILREADPVVTSEGGRLRFEAFSQCCGLYARADLRPEALDGETLGKGTTNVDFNSPLRNALGEIRAGERVGLNVGLDELELERCSASVIERKVDLPARWLKGFVETQAYGARLRRRFELKGPEARRFLRGLPRQARAKDQCWLVPRAGGLRISQTAARDGVCVGGLARLRFLERLIPVIQGLTLHADAESGVTGWEVDLADQSLQVLLSPMAARGFSGEGQVLSKLAEREGEELLARTKAALAWQGDLTAEGLAGDLGASTAAVEGALARLGSHGLVGFDFGRASYFHRVLPFDLGAVETLHPRLLAARKIVADAGVRDIRQQGAVTEAYVLGSSVEHRVRLGPEGYRCSCPWFSKQQGQAGPCKHVLALQITLEGEG